MSPADFLLNPLSLPPHVGTATYVRGLGVYRSQQVLDCAVQLDDGGWRIDGAVQGSERLPYATSVRIETTAQGVVTAYRAQCSCPVGSTCKHSVALTLKAAHQAGGFHDGQAAAAPEPDPLAHQQALLQAARAQAHERACVLAANWLAQCDGDTVGATPAAAGEQLVYTLAAVARNPHPVLHLGRALTRRLRNGSWGKAKQPHYFHEVSATPEDQEIGRLISSLNASAYSYGAPSQQAELAGHAGLLALRLAAATGRLFWLSDARVPEQPVLLGPARPLEWAWHADSAPNTPEPYWSLLPQLPAAAGPAQWFGNQPPLYLDLQAGLCGPLESAGVAPERMARLLRAPPIPQSAFADHEAALLRGLDGLPLPPVVTPPRVLQGVVPTAHLRIAVVPLAEVPLRGLLSARLAFDYQGLRHDGRGSVNPVLLTDASAAGGAARVLLHRDLDAEAAAEATLHRLGLVGDAHHVFGLPPDPAAQQCWLQWADDDFAPLRAAGFTLSCDASLDGWIQRADALQVDLATPGAMADGNDSNSPWFDLSLGMDIGGERHNILPLLPALLARLGGANGDRLPPHVYLPHLHGRYLRLPTAPLRPWLQALVDLVGERGNALQGDTLRLSRLEALRLGTALRDGAQWQGADRLRQMVQQLTGRQDLPAVTPPAGLQASLRPYQQLGLDWLQFLRTHGLAGILADDMGLGKTLQTLAHLLVEKEAGRLDRPALVIAPVSLLGNWRREAGRFAPGLRVLVLHGKERHAAAAQIAGHDLVIAPYSLLQRDRERWLRQAWHLVVLDEAQNIKNANTHAAQVVADLDTRHRLCLSGTPMENHLGELWSLFHFLMPGFLGSQARFKELFRTPIEKHGDGERLAQLRRRVTPFMLRRAKRDVEADLPEKQESITSVELGDKQADLYETIRLATEKTVREALADKGLAKSHIQVLDALLKLRQVCCDPRLVPLAAAQKLKQSAKLELLMDMLPEMLAEGRRVLLFSQFTSMLALIEDELARHKLPWVKLTGQSQGRDQIIERFTSGEVPLFLISLKAGGVGLNLTQADTVIHYDPWWNPAVEEQATARAHRIGQTQRVMVYKLVAQGNFEERILALQERKAALADSMYSAATARKQPLFTESDLQELLKPLGS